MVFRFNKENQSFADEMKVWPEGELYYSTKEAKMVSTIVLVFEIEALKKMTCD